MIECDPIASDFVDRVALSSTKASVPMTVVPSLNVTSPAGEPAGDVTVAVNATTVPTVVGLIEAVSVVDVAAAVTSTEIAGELAPLKSVDPP